MDAGRAAADYKYHSAGVLLPEAAGRTVQACKRRLARSHGTRFSRGTFKGAALATTMMEGGGKTPWHPPSEFAEMGYSMILYPTSILFRAARAMERAVADLRAGRRLDMKEAMSKDEFMKLVGLEYWQGVEKKFHP